MHSRIHAKARGFGSSPGAVQPKAVSTTLDAATKAQVETKAQELIYNVLKPGHVKPPPEDARFNYPVGAASPGAYFGPVLGDRPRRPVVHAVTGPTHPPTFCRSTGIPLVYDVHHHRCNQDDLAAEDATEQAIATWKREAIIPLSSPNEG
jgi:hypothetical protein